MAIKKLPKRLHSLRDSVLSLLDNAAIQAAQDEAEGNESGDKGWEFFLTFQTLFVEDGNFSSRELAVVLKYLEDRGEIIQSRRPNPFNENRKGGCYKLADTREFK